MTSADEDENAVRPRDLLRERQGQNPFPRLPRSLAPPSFLQTPGGHLASPSSSTPNTHPAPCVLLPGHSSSSPLAVSAVPLELQGLALGGHLTSPPGRAWLFSPQTQSPQGQDYLVSEGTW